MRTTALTAAACLSAALAPAPAQAQLRVAQWNITDYSGPGDRDAAFRTALYEEFQGRSLRPDVLVVQEIRQGSDRATGQTSVDAFLALLNQEHLARTGVADAWAAAPYVFNSGDRGNALFFLKSKAELLETRTLNQGTGVKGPPRDNQRWRLRLVGYAGPDAELYLYGAHFKANTNTADQTRRALEAERIRTDSNSLPQDSNFLLCADLNIQNSAQTAYQYLTTTLGAAGFWSIARGRFHDPINTPGPWENNCSFRYVHTQEPATAMDSRHDQILVSAALRDGAGMSYMPAVPGGNTNLPYSASTWNDPNHSYRAWGNDGSPCDDGAINSDDNAMVGPAIADALVATVSGNGHLPVFLDLRVPARVIAPAAIEFPQPVPAGAADGAVDVQLTNGDLARFSRDGDGAGIAQLTYSLAVSGGFALESAGPFTLGGGASRFHRITLTDAGAPGPRHGTLTITSDETGRPTILIPITATVTGAGDPDLDVNDDGLINAEDLYAWFRLFTDVDANGVADAQDALALIDGLRPLENVDATHGRR